jgi:hypothetical protein
MRRLLHYWILMRGSLSSAVWMLIAFAAGVSASLFLLPFWVRPFLVAAEKGNPSDWVGFAGNFGAGVMTLVAAAIAWHAVQDQIANARDVAADQAAAARAEAEADQMEAKRMAIIGISQAVVAASMMLKTAERAMHAVTNDEIEKWDNALDQSAGQVEDGLSNYGLRQILGALGHTDRMCFLMFLTQLGTIVSIYRRPPGTLDRKQRLKTLCSHLEGLPKYLKTIDHNLVELFQP